MLKYLNNGITFWVINTCLIISCFAAYEIQYLGFFFIAVILAFLVTCLAVVTTDFKDTILVNFAGCIFSILFWMPILLMITFGEKKLDNYFEIIRITTMIGLLGSLGCVGFIKIRS